MSLLKQSTEASCIIGPVLDSAGVEYGSAVIGDLSISKNGGTLTAMASSATLTYIANGMYTLAMTTENTDTVGRIEISCNKATYQMSQKNFLVLLASVFDTIITNEANTTGGIISATSTVSSVAGYVGSSGEAINGTNVNMLSSHDPGVTIGTSTYSGGAVESVTGSVGSVTGITSSDISAIKAKTDNLPTSPAAVGSAMTLASSLDLYHTDIEFNDDGANNEYTVVWFKNGVRITSGITVPTIQVISRSDGTDFIASTTMTQISTTGAYKFNTSTVITAGETYLVIIGATIDGSSRSFAKLISRDA